MLCTGGGTAGRAEQVSALPSPSRPRGPVMTAETQGRLRRPRGGSFQAALSTAWCFFSYLPCLPTLFSPCFPPRSSRKYFVVNNWWSEDGNLPLDGAQNHPFVSMAYGMGGDAGRAKAFSKLGRAATCTQSEASVSKRLHVPLRGRAFPVGAVCR